MKSQDFHPPGQPQSRGILLRCSYGVRAPREDLRRAVHLVCGAPALLLRDYPAGLVVGLVAFLLCGYWLTVAMRWQLPIMRTGERWVSGAVTYWIGVIIALALLPAEAAAVGWVVMAVGDPTAAWVGQRFPLRMLRDERSFGGTLAFILFAALGAAGVVVFGYGPILKPVQFVGILAAALAGAVVEFICMRWDDNLFIPFFSGAVYLLVVSMISGI